MQSFAQIVWFLIEALPLPLRPLDIQQRCVVEAVEAHDIHLPVSDGEMDIYFLRSDGVGPRRGAEAEYAGGHITHAVTHRQLHHVAPGAVEPLQDKRPAARREPVRAIHEV